ncbi:NUDIX hydrolase [Algirhabdus cladophorae]|uniref:NUDIX hydrolase n=1 Tax=Algirhabdus cladophorae TaxID=3377108 RepID=UPI003B847E59
MDKSAIRNAATVILQRSTPDGPAILVGQRGAKAAFMPNKFVFPGGAVDPADGNIPLGSALPAPCDSRLREDGSVDPNALATAAIRELWEETGLILGTPAAWPDAPEDWHAFAAHGMRPHAAHLRFFFRAITPPGRPRRFDARFFLIDADHISGDLDDFSAASDELSHLHWVPLADVLTLDLPFITEVVLAEVARHPDPSQAPQTVPFFKNTDEESLFLRLNGAPLED